MSYVQVRLRLCLLEPKLVVLIERDGAELRSGVAGTAITSWFLEVACRCPIEIFCFASQIQLSKPRHHNLCCTLCFLRDMQHVRVCLCDMLFCTRKPRKEAAPCYRSVGSLSLAGKLGCCSFEQRVKLVERATAPGPVKSAQRLGNKSTSK